MHILTKVFVVIASLLSVIMAALTISFAVNASRISTDYSNALRAQDTAEAELAASNQIKTREQAQLREQIDRLQQEKAQLAATIHDNEALISQLTISERQARASRDSIEGKIAQLGVTTQTQAELIDEYKTEVSRLRDSELRWRSDKLDIEGKLSDLESQTIVYEQRQRALAEQLTEAQRSAEHLRGGGDLAAKAGRGALPTEILGPPIRGTVQQVRVEPSTGDTLIRISLGSNDRVRLNNKLFLNRGGRVYLGDVIIIESDLNHAIGRIVNPQKGIQVQVGDQVWSKLGA